MAVDTAEKRYSMIAFGDGDQILFEVDSAVDLDDRQHLLGCYSGIAFDSSPACRFSFLAFGDADQVLFPVDGSVDLDDRQHLLGCYSCIAFDTPAPGATATNAMMMGV